MQIPRVYVGIDPGIIHTGLVRLVFPPDGSGERWWKVDYAVVNGVDAAAVQAMQYWIAEDPAHVAYVEDYRARTSTRFDPEMIKAVDRIKTGLNNTRLINNSGSKQTIRTKLLKMLDVYKFPATHHQDLQAAARILVWGMLKNDYTNELLAGFVADNLDGKVWTKHVSAVLP